MERGSILGEKKQKSKGYLENFFRSRAPKEELEKRNILPKQDDLSSYPSGSTSPMVAVRQKELEKTNKKSMLNNFLKRKSSGSSGGLTSSGSNHRRRNSLRKTKKGKDSVYAMLFLFFCYFVLFVAICCYFVLKLFFV